MNAYIINLADFPAFALSPGIAVGPSAVQVSRPRGSPRNLKRRRDTRLDVQASKAV